jgi:hypothetical protein
MPEIYVLQIVKEISPFFECLENRKYNSGSFAIPHHFTHFNYIYFKDALPA